MTNPLNLPQLVQAIDKSVEAGMAAAEAAPNDGGSANLDHVVIVMPKGTRLATLQAAGIDCRKSSPGCFALGTQFPGQGNRRFIGVQAQVDALRAAGVDCYVHYQID